MAQRQERQIVQSQLNLDDFLGDVRPRVPLGGYLVNPVTTSQIMDMWVEGGCYRPAGTPDSGCDTPRHR